MYSAERKCDGGRETEHPVYPISRFSRESSDTMAKRVIMSDVAKGTIAVLVAKQVQDLVFA
jgi:hypothetical protein